MTIHEAALQAAKCLREADIPDPEADAALLLSHLTRLSPMEVRLQANQPLTPQQEQRLSSLLLSRAKREPLQYLLREQWFYGLCFQVDENVLIPRQETETLCELGIRFLKGRREPMVLDLCTGSGAIAVTLKHECPAACVTAADLSKAALAVAKGNAEKNRAEISFVQGDLFAPVQGQRFDLILTNPPYIETEECSRLQPEVLREPRMALDGGLDGLDFYRRIALEAERHLSQGGLLAAEVGDGQARQVAELFAETGRYGNTEIHTDLYGKERIVSVHAASMPT